MLSRRVLIVFLFVFVVPLMVGISYIRGRKLDALAVQPAAVASKVYVANNGSNGVLVIGSKTNAVVANISVGQGPYDLELGLNSGMAYVSNFIDQTVSIINTNTNTVAATIPGLPANPTIMAIDPSNTRLYSCGHDFNQVMVMDITYNSFLTTIDIGQSCEALIVSPDGSKLYVTGGTTLVVVDLVSSLVVDTTDIGDTLEYVAVNSLGSRLYIATFKPDVVVFDTSNNTVISRIVVGSSPLDVAISADNSLVYTTNLNGSNTVSVIDTVSNVVVDTISVVDQPTQIALSPDEKFAYVTHNDTNVVSVIDTGSRMVVKILGVGVDPNGIAVKP